jgi:hypothetical protein
MRTLRWTVIVFVFIFLQAAFAQTPEKRNEFGLGLILGEPSGLNTQFYWGPHQSVDVTAAWSLSDWFMAMGDFQFYNRIADSPANWKWYYGLGAYLAAPRNDDGTFGLRIPLGLTYRVPSSAVEIWGEVAPALRLVPDTAPELQGGIGVTFWLK